MSSELFPFPAAPGLNIPKLGDYPREALEELAAIEGRMFLEMEEAEMTHDPVDHPAHYTQHPSGIECIQITEHMGFCLGNAVKYIWRADLKNGVEDLKKARWYIDREIERRDR